VQYKLKVAQGWGVAGHVELSEKWVAKMGVRLPLRADYAPRWW
jgi:hypothetical protein